MRRSLALERLLALLTLAFIALAPAGASAATNMPGGTYHSQAQIESYFANSNNSYLRDNASTFAAMSRNVENSTGYTGLYNGSCCTGLMQMNRSNLREFCNCTPEQYATMSGQQQIDVYGKYYSSIQNDPSVRQLREMQANGQTLGGQPVTGGTIAACIQLGTGNCRDAIRNGCSSTARGQGGDGHVNICTMGAKAGDGKGGTGSNPSACTTPSEPKAPTDTPASGSSGTSGSSTGGSSGSSTGGVSASGSAGSSAAASNTPDSVSGILSAGTPSKDVPCKEVKSDVTDKTSKTCGPTMQMINALQCSNFPANLQGFCNQYKPKLMNDGECRSAEQYAEKQAKGDRQTECENQTFGSKGTGSWSFVLACSRTTGNQGANGNAYNAMTGQGTGSAGSGKAGTGGGGGTGKPTGPATDPQCVERMKQKIPGIKTLGQVTLGYYNGQACNIPSAVQYSGKAVDFGKSLTMDCNLAEKLENFGEAAKGLGLTKYTPLGTTSCRGINNASGVGQSKLSTHGTGQAFDVNGFYVNGTLWKTDLYFKDNGTQTFFRSKILPLACEKFTGVLGPVFYKGKWNHYHFDSRDRGTTECKQRM